MIEKIIDIAIGAGDEILKIREEGFSTQTKNDSFDFVTTADIKSEEYILKRLSSEFPNDSILSEEKGLMGNNISSFWMVDPLDGTKDFKNGGDGFSIMIGLCQNGEPVLGVVYAPAKNLIYHAQKGKGAYQRINGNDQKLNVSQTAKVHDAILITRIPHGEKRKEDQLEELFDVKEKLPESSVGIKLGLIASGKADFHINTNFRANKWDTCAPQVILEEAGGEITDFYGNKLDYSKPSEGKWLNSFVASNQVLHKYAIDKIKEFYSRK